MNTLAAQLPNHKQLNSPFLNAIHKHKSPSSNVKQWRTITNTKRQTMADRQENNGGQWLKQWRGKNGDTPCSLPTYIAVATFAHVKLGFLFAEMSLTGPLKVIYP
jgi:hypothetical protein